MILLCVDIRGYHAYEFDGVDKIPTMDGLTGKMYTKIKFYNRDFESEVN